MIKVLVIDDSALMRKLLGRVLADVRDFEVHFARNGIEGLEQLAAVNPDIVTLDIHMPGMDGLACLDRIMIEHPRPVLMVSSSTRDGADVTLEALRLGAVDFALKPEGALSLHMDVFGPLFVAKVRAAAGAKLRASLRLRERVQHRFRGSVSALPRVRGAAQAPERAEGDGIVVVGTSTGGPSALELLLGALPSTFPWPIVIAQHMPASFTGALARRLDGLCADRRQGGRLAPPRSSPATPISGAAMATLLFRRSPAIWSSRQPQPMPGAHGIRAPTAWWRARSRMFPLTSWSAFL